MIRMLDYADWANAPGSAKEQGLTNVGLHGSSPGHTKQDIWINVLEFTIVPITSPTTKDVRENRGQHWMHKL